MLTTIGWAGRVDDVSRRLLIHALRTAAHGGPLVRLPAFAALACDLFRHVSQTLVPPAGDRFRRRRLGHPARDRPPDTFITQAGAESDALPADLLAAIDALRSTTRLQPRLTLTDCAAIVRLMRATRPALYGLLAALGAYLEHALQPHISRSAVRAFILETRRELDDLAPCRTVGGAYVETLTITEADDKTVGLEIEASLGGVAPRGYT